jgi:putative pyruvate formate lyase activating enzyme
VAYIGPHFGEEPPISGYKGSGTVFFTGCTLKCSFCQNYQISKDGIGRTISSHELVDEIVHMIERFGVHNVNFVTPDHFFPHVFDAIFTLKNRGYNTPVVLNLSGYQSIEMIKVSDDYTDIYLPDFKYSDGNLAYTLSRCRDYPSTALDAISTMIKQKGFLDSFFNNAPIARKGVLVRHLILPGMIKNSIDALTMLRVEFGEDLPISLMSQYYPVKEQPQKELNRSVSRHEFEMVYEYAMELGFRYMFVQYPTECGCHPEGIKYGVPDFTLDPPFKWPHD